MTPEKLKEIEARCEAASEGPWDYQYEADGAYDLWSRKLHEVPSLLGQIDTDEDDHHATNEANATFIAHARTDVPDLIARVKELEERIASAKSGLVVQHENAFVDPEDVRATIAILDGCNVTVDEEVNRLRAENEKLQAFIEPMLSAALGGGDE